MKKTIYLHGYLKKLHDKPIVVEADSVAEAVRALELIPELRPADGAPHPVTIDGITADIQLFALGGLDEIHIRPRAGGGGGKGGLMQVLLGVALIGLAVVMGPGATLFGGFLSSQSLFLTGAMMALGGVVQMLTPTPDTTKEEEASRYTAATGNTVQIGTRIPILFGSRKIFGHYLTFDVDAKEVDTGTTTGFLNPVPATGSPPLAARFGYAPYNVGQFAYSFWKPDTPEAAQAAGSVFPPTTDWAMFARGYINTINPGPLWSVIHNSAHQTGFMVRYTTWIRPVTTGVHSLQLTAPEQYQAKFFTSAGVEVPSGNLTAGHVYQVEIFFLRTYIPLTTVVYGVNLIQPGGASTPLASSPILENIGTTAPIAPPPVTVRDNIFITYDQPVLANPLRPIRPIFANPTTSPGEVPGSDWNP